jgi:hypothetical protein
MAFDESFAARIRAALYCRKNVEEKKMFCSGSFLLNGNLHVGVWNVLLIARLGPFMERQHCEIRTYGC